MVREQRNNHRPFNLLRFLLGTSYLEGRVLAMEYKLMSAITDLTDIVTKLDTDVAALIAAVPAAGDNPAVVAAVAALTALDGTVIAATPIPVTP